MKTMKAKKAYRMVEGHCVLTRGFTFIQAAAELAKDGNCEGRIIFSCPNYAVVKTGPRTEVTIWSK